MAATVLLIVCGAAGLVLPVPIIWPIVGFVAGCGVFLTAARVERAALRASTAGLVCRLAGAGMFAGATILIVARFLKVLLIG